MQELREKMVNQQEMDYELSKLRKELEKPKIQEFTEVRKKR